MLQKIWNHIKKIDYFLDSHTGLLLLLLLVVLLRVPTLSDPYWYGDEAIYLTIGQAMNRGVELYSEIIDHKTPLIYVFAQVGTQLNFRLLLLAWMVVSTIGFYILSLKLLKQKLSAVLATLAFVLLTTLPTFEGHIPNGELFVMGFMIWGGVLMSWTNFFGQFFDDKSTSLTSSRQTLILLGAGVLFGLGILTKVPAVFDMAAFLGIGFFSVTAALFADRSESFFQSLRRALVPMFLIGLGMLIPIAFSVVWFVARGSGQAYLDFGLLYNFRYSGSWELPFTSQFVLFLFSLPGKALITTLVGVSLAAGKKYFTPTAQFVIFWFFLALFASTLSNRPYPHYFLQVMPPLALLFGLVAQSLRKSEAIEISWSGSRVMQVLAAPIALIFFVVVIVLLQVSPYATISYYSNWWNFVRGQTTTEEYRSSFNHLMNDNYAAAVEIASTGDEKLFIWGTNPMLYALTNTEPTGRFTVSFHIADFDAYDETLNDLKEDNPRHIVVMHDEFHEFPGFTAYLNRNYFVEETYDNFTLWRRQPFKL